MDLNGEGVHRKRIVMPGDNISGLVPERSIKNIFHVKHDDIYGSKIHDGDVYSGIYGSKFMMVTSIVASVVANS
ncbi:hypothetical protein CEXT_80741 [Caerostris extrusa]|uniref:DNA-directed RNA polymerase n=1 Tax=Caerostris extrusa TaxID=172846 RepID=A0AAV4MMP2_CAEEX|nr:hypothetical protein CEXT_80741 [Caerostris extrusa]